MYNLQHICSVKSVRTIMTILYVDELINIITNNIKSKNKKSWNFSFHSLKARLFSY